MKKQSIIFGLALAMLTVGCAKDATEDVAVKGNEVTIGVTADATRTSLGAKDGETYPVLWSEGDQVSVNGVASKTIAEQFVGTASAQFTVEGVAAPYKVVYPAGIAAEGGYVIVASPEQDYVANSFDGAFAGAAMVGYSESEQVAMKNVCGFIKLPIKKGDEKNIEKVVIRTNNLESIAGSFDVNYETGEIIRPYAGVDFVTVTADETIPYVEDMAVVVAAVAPGTYAKGFTVEVIAADGAYMTKTAYAATGCTVNAGKVLVMPEIEFFPNKQKTEITNATQLQAFLDAASAGDYSAWKNNDGVVELGDDIDLTGVTIKPATSFDGVFDGRNYCLYNWKSDGASMFAKLDAGGVIKNVVIGEACELTLPTATSGAFGFLVAENYGTVSGCQNYANVNGEGSFADAGKTGILIGASYANSKVVGCYNAGNMTITKTGNAAGTNNFGTIQGYMISSSTADTEIKGCINKGNITITITDGTTAKNIYIGGVTGSSNSYTKTTDCINEGDVLYHICATTIDADNKASGAAIVFGGVTSYSAGAVSNCKNFGNLTIESDFATVGDKLGAIKGTMLGGIAGYQNGPIVNCENRGALTIECGIFGGRNSVGSIDGTASYSASAPAIGGILAYGYSNASSPFSVNNCNNYGKITYRQNQSDVAGNTYSGRHSFGGIAAAPWGDITNCNNYGDIDLYLVTSNRSALNQNLMPVAGGISGGDYYPKNQNNTNITNCTNEGNITIVCDGLKSNCAFGGIVGWSGIESTAQTVVTKGCINRGDITIGGYGKARVGGIQGGSGNIEDCTNYGNLIYNDTAAASAIGGVAGFHTAGHHIYNSNNYGSVTSTQATIGTGGYVGNFGNSAQTCYGGAVDCKVTVPAGGRGGLVAGWFNGVSKVIVVGTAENPLYVKGSVTKGEVVATISTAADITRENIYGGVSSSTVDKINCDPTNILILE